MKNLKLLPLSLAAVMGLSLLSGCAAAPKSASAVVEKYVSQMEKSCNYHMDMEMNFDVTATAQGGDIGMPVETVLSADVFEDMLHGKMNVTASVTDETMEYEMEVYTDEDGKAYVHNSETNAWSESENTEAEAAAFGFTNLDKDSFTDAVLMEDKQSGTYTVTQKFADFAASGSVYGMLEDMYCSMYETAGIDDLLEACEDAEVVYIFDKDCYLTSAVITGCTYSGNFESSGVGLDIDVDINFSFKFSNYGEIKKDDVKVPDEVREAVITKNDGVKEKVDVNEGRYDDSDWNEDQGFQSSNSWETDPKPATSQKTDSDMLGSYNGTNITGQKDDWDIFGKDGWKLSEDDGALTFVTAKNPKYENVEMYVYNSKRADATADEIRSDGFYGYSIDCSLSNARPPMTWNGLTFGADAEDIIEVYGNNYDLFEGDLYASYRYMIADNTELTFHVYPDGGMLTARLDYYGGI